MWHNESENRRQAPKTAVMVVAYPGDETFFAGGQVLLTPSWRWHIVTVFSGRDPAISQKFINATTRLNATGEILGMPENPDKQTTLPLQASAAVVRVLSARRPDILVTHSPFGECRKLLGRDVIGRIVTKLWYEDEAAAHQLWVFAYEDDNVDTVPMAADESDRSICLPSETIEQKRRVLLDSYAFGGDSFFARTAPTEEAFFCFRDAAGFGAWRKNRLATSPKSSTMPPSATPRRTKGAIPRTDSTRGPAARCPVDQ